MTTLDHTNQSRRDLWRTAGVGIQNMLRKWWLLLAVIAPAIVCAADDRARSCEESWNQAYAAFQQQQDGDAKFLLQKWLGLESQCRGTGIYEFRLATLYLRVDQPQRALDVLNGAKSYPPPYAAIVPMAKVRAQIAVLADETPIPWDKVRALKPQVLAALQTAPNDYVGNEEVANYMAMIGDADSAITYGEKAAALREDQWETHRTLTMAYFQKGDYVKSLVNARRAQELRHALIDDPPFMYVVAKAYAGVGNMAAVKSTMGLLLNEKPGERGTPEYREAVNFIAAEIKKGNLRN
jgi:tetratricopeptide (TPR) repeat protein